MNFPLAFIEGIGGPELMLIMFIILLLFGANKLPELAKGLGKSVKEFKKAAADVEYQIKEAMEEKPAESEESKRFAPKPVTPVAEQPKTFPSYPPGATPPAKPVVASEPNAAPDTAPATHTPPPPEAPKA